MNAGAGSIQIEYDCPEIADVFDVCDLLQSAANGGPQISKRIDGI
jgi:hypothetical protein